MLRKYKTVNLDFDGCIVDTISAIVSLYNEDFSYYKDFKKVNWWDVQTWNFTECTCASADYINTYFNQPRLFERLEFMPRAQEVIETLQCAYKVRVVSHGFSPNLRIKKEWVENNLPGVEFLGVNLKKHSDKSSVDMRDSFFLDDSMKNLLSCNADDMACFGDLYPWNEDWGGKRMLNWTDVLRYLL